MRTFDFTPLLRSSIGFENLRRLTDSLAHMDAGEVAYPPYNIEKTAEDEYRITMAVAGFAREELDITIQDNGLIVAGKASESDKSREFLHRGIAKRAFERQFELAENIKVVGATFENGLLNIELVREIPEHKRPRKIEISATKSKLKSLTKKAA